MTESTSGIVAPTTSVAASPSRLIRTWSPWVSTTDASVTCGSPSRSASIAGTTLIAPSVEAIPHTTRSTFADSPSFSTALASTSEVPIASEPAIAVVHDVHALVAAHLQRLAHRVQGLLRTRRTAR